MTAFCTECGTRNEDKRLFCGECGAKLPESIPTVKQAQTLPKLDLSFLGKWSKRTKTILIVSVSFIMLCLLFFQTGKYLTDQDRLISKFEKALKSEDAAFLQAKLITSTDGEELSTEQAMDLIQYMNQDTATLEGIIDSLKDTTNQLNRDEENVEDSNVPRNLVSLRENGKFLLIFDQYELVLKPVHIYLYSNYPDATLSLNGNIIADQLITREEDQMVIGPLIPGKYTIEGEIKTDYIEVMANSSVQAFEDAYQDLIFDIQTIDIRSSYPNTKLYANGTDTGLVLNEEEVSFGPVTLDGTLELYGITEAPFGDLKSDPVYVDGSSVELNFSTYDDVIPVVMADANKFILSWYKTLNTLDPSYLINATENYNASVTENPMNIRDSYGIDREFVKKTLYGVDNLSLLQNEDGIWEAYIPVSITSTGDKYNDLVLQLGLIYSESKKEWQVDQLYSIYNVNSTEVKEHSFDSVEQETNTPKAKVPLEADSLMSKYLYGLVNAIHSNNLDYVESLLYPDSELYKSQKNLVERLYNDGIGEDVVSYTVHSSEPLNDGNDAYKIRVSETIRIYKDSGNEDHTYEWWYYSKSYNDEQRLYKIEKVQ